MIVLGTLVIPPLASAQAEASGPGASAEATSAASVKDAARLSDSKAALQKWVQTRQVIARTRRDWAEEKELLNQTTLLFEKELVTLDEQISTVNTNNTQVMREQADLNLEREGLLEALDLARQTATSLEAKIRTLVPQWPPPLLEKIDPLLKRIPELPEDTKLSPVERMQNIVGIVNEVDKFNTAISVVSEVQKNPEGVEVQVQTLYLGLGQAYFVDRSGEHAGYGVPSAQGWNWTTRPELGPRILQAIAVYESASPAAFVALPAQIK